MLNTKKQSQPNKMEQYKVGQVLFILNPERGIIPIKIAEIVTRETEFGKKVDALVLTPQSKTKDETFKLDDLLSHGSIFSDIEKLKSQMIQNARFSIEDIIETTLKFCKEKYDFEPIKSKIEKNIGEK